MDKCNKCSGTGWYAYDENHSQVCDACCKHDKGWWALTPSYMGYFRGAMCCKAGCGKVITQREYKRLKVGL